MATPNTESNPSPRVAEVKVDSQADDDAALTRTSTAAAKLKARGNAAFQAGDTKRAIKFYEKALAKAEVHPKENAELKARLHGNLCQCHKRQKRFQLALAQAEKAAKVCPSWAKAHALKAEALYKLRRWNDAAKAARAGLLALGPSGAGADGCSSLRRALQSSLDGAESERERSGFLSEDAETGEIKRWLDFARQRDLNIDEKPLLIRRQPACLPPHNVGFTNLNLIHVAAFNGDANLVDKAAALGAAIDRPTLPPDTCPHFEDGGPDPPIYPAPRATALVLTCANLAMLKVADRMGGPDMGSDHTSIVTSPAAALRLIALGADLDAKLDLGPPSPEPMGGMNPSNYTLDMAWRMMGLGGMSVTQLALCSGNQGLAEAIVRRGVDISAVQLSRLPPFFRPQVKDMVIGLGERARPPSPPLHDSDVLHCRCGSHLVWSECHGDESQRVSVHYGADSALFIRYSPRAPCPCTVESGKVYSKCCWASALAYFQNDSTAEMVQCLGTRDDKCARARRLLQEMRLAEGADPSRGYLFPARDEDGRDLGRAMTREEYNAHKAELIRNGIEFSNMREYFGPKCEVARSWDPEVVASVVQRIPNTFTWFDTHWSVSKPELLSRTKEWNETLRTYLDERATKEGWDEETRAKTEEKHTASPLAPCANPSCDAVEARVKEFCLCKGCRRVGYCSPSCQRTHWQSGHSEWCKLNPAIG